MPKQTQSTEYVLRADPQSQTLIGQHFECALNHRHGLAIGNPLRRILQILKGETQPTAQALGIDAFVLRDFGEGLQKKRRDQRQFKGRVLDFYVHGG
ncbi:hypothetical protein D3C78_1557320 [compost metagenome]